MCGGTRFVDWRFGLLRCEQCNLVVAGSVWRPAANEQLNEASFGDDYEPIRSFWTRIFETLNNRRTISRLRRAVDAVGGKCSATPSQSRATPHEPWKENRGRLLEIGVGSGSFLAHAKIHGYSPLGCDLSPAICRRVEQNTGLSMHCGALESLSDEQFFDFVVMNHLLEHVSDPVTLLKTVRAHLNPGGLLHLAVPNVASWEARLSGWNSYEPYHLLYFTPRTLRLAAEEAGFEIKQIMTHESFSGWFLSILRTLLRKNHLKQAQQSPSGSIKQSSAFVEHAYRVVMVMCGLFTLPLRRLQELLGEADEIILLAKKGNDVR